MHGFRRGLGLKVSSPHGFSWRYLSLAGRSRVRIILCALQERQEMVLGNILARRWRFLLDLCPVDSRIHHDAGCRRHPLSPVVVDAWLHLSLRRTLGIWRPHLWLDDALPWHVARAWVLPWDTVPRSARSSHRSPSRWIPSLDIGASMGEIVGSASRVGHARRNLALPRRHFHRCSGWLDEGTRDARSQKTGGD